ncbi:MAG: FkbM family methyltransferase [Crocinitomicaceae bacterium]|nr:FkbM family methyltransferase [Crocinitomicaceae bacterium]
MKFIRKILVKLFGLKGYLKIVSKIYIKFIRLGFYKEKYAELHFTKEIVKPDSVVIDIGSNLGYYATLIGKTVRNEGKLIGVEPIPLFAEIWKSNMKSISSPNIILEQCALGSEPQDEVKMSIPIVDGVVRHGLTKIDSSENTHESMQSYTVQMRVGDEIVTSNNLQKIDYIKCDVEGYEQYVIPSLKSSIEKFKPLFQIELGGKENRQKVVEFLGNLGYEKFILSNGKLNRFPEENLFKLNQDFYFVHSSKMENWQHLIKN